jgi:hypothetical protein
VSLSLEQRENYLYIKISDNYTEDILESGLKELFTECRNSNHSKLLIDALDIDLKSIKTLDRFNIGVKIAELSIITPFIKVACVCRKQFSDGFTVTVANNRGAQFKAFYNEDEAVEWLLK